MDLINLYIYTGIPLITCNMLFYSVSAISTSITSSQNVVRFISEHKKTDISIFKEEIDKHDLTNKLNIIKSLIYDVIKLYCFSTDEYNTTICSIHNDSSVSIDFEDKDKNDGFMMIELTNTNTVFNRIDQPVKLAIVSTSEIVQHIQNTMNTVRDKTIAHESSYLNKLRPLSLQSELSTIHADCIKLDQRISMLFSILHLYLANKIANK